MKKSLLAIALALGVSSLTYTAAAAPKSDTPSQKDTTKKHKKNKTKKSNKKTDRGSK
jgi:hypothetical protein